MHDVHEQLYHLRKSRKNQTSQNLLVKIAKNIAHDTMLLCLDELQITDITDAMIIAKLFSELWKNNVIPILTSNTEPSQLYLNGLQREQFSPFITLLQKKTHIIQLRSQYDYRSSMPIQLKDLYHSPSSQETEKKLANIFDHLTDHNQPQPTTLTIQGRNITFENTHNTILWTTFTQLCTTYLGPKDYIEIAKHFTIMILSGIPQFTSEYNNAAKRFILLIDQLYEHKVTLICSAETTIDKLYEKMKRHPEYKRTISRLTEMQSKTYIEKCRQSI